MSATHVAVPSAALPPLLVTGRAAQVRDVLADPPSSVAPEPAHALLVTTPSDVRWLTGFTGSAGQVLVLPDRMVLVTDGRYAEQAEVELAAADAPCEVVIGRTAAAQAEALAAALGSVARLGLQADGVTWARQRELVAQLPGCTLVPVTGLVLGLRQVKDPAEVARMEQAAAVADAALAAVLPLLEQDVTEERFAAELEHAMRLGGAEGPSFPTIVGSGPNGARPHHRPGPRVIADGDLVVVDFGARVQGYCSDMTRTLAVGDVPHDAAELLAVVGGAQAAGVAAVRAGVTAAAVDAVCRSSIETAGHGERFVHGTGHGLGLDIHEPPWISATSASTLVAGNVITVEPGVYRAGFGGVRVEDAVLVTPEGCRVLTRFPKDPRCLPSAPTTSRPA